MVEVKFVQVSTHASVLVYDNVELIAHLSEFFPDRPPSSLATKKGSADDHRITLYCKICLDALRVFYRLRRVKNVSMPWQC